jgi:putative oxidoreductase
MFAHGAQKAWGWWGGPGYARWRAAVQSMGFRPAALFAPVSIAAELSGFLLVFGFLTPLVGAMIVAQAVAIIGKAHLPKGFWNTSGGFEYPLALGAGAAAITLTGAGAYSVDAAIGFALAPEARIALVLLGIVGGLAALAYPQLTMDRSTASDHG